MQLNTVIRVVKRDSDLEMVFRKIDIENLMVITYADAAWAVRRDGKSQGGFITVAVDKSKAETGKKVKFNVLDYGSKKLKRMAKSSLAGGHCPKVIPACARSFL